MFLGYTCFGQGEIYFDKIDSKEDILNPWISHLYEDDQGFIWIATQDGVLRYDGYDFKTIRYHPNDSNSISANWVTYTLQDKLGNFWFGTYGDGLNQLDISESTITQYNTSEFDGTVIKKIIVDLENTIWVLSEKGIAYKESSSNTFQKIEKSDQWSHIDMTADGKIWIIHFSDLYVFDPLEKEMKLQFHFDENLNYLEAIDKTLFIAADSRGILFENNTIVRVDDLPKDIRTWSNFENGSSYFASTNSVFRYSISEANYAEVTKFDTSTSVQSLLIDSKKQLWIGTDKGLYKENKLAEKFKHAPINYHARRIIQQNNTLYFGGNAGVHIFKDNQYHQLLSDRNIISLYVDDNLTLWAGDIQGVLYEINTNQQIKTHKIPYKEVSGLPFLYAIVEDKKGRLWLGTWDGVFIVSKEGEILHRFRLLVNGNDVNYRILKMMSDSKDRLWIVGPSHGLFKIDHFSDFAPEKPKLTIKNYQRNSKDANTLNSNVTVDIHEDKLGKIWVATDVGLNALNEETDSFVPLVNQDKLFDEKIMAIEHDEENRLWLSAITKGIFVYDQQTKSFTHYNKEDGLISNAFLFTSSNFGGDKKLYFGSDQGIQIIDPLLFKNHIDSNKPVITDFDIANLTKKNIDAFTLTYKDTIEVNPPHSNFSVSFSSLNFSTSVKVNYAFKLEGLEDKWNFTKSNLNTAYYTNIDYGTYKFRVKAFDTTQGIESGMETMLTVIVIPPWYLSNLAYAVYFILAFGLIIFIYRILVQRRLAHFKVEQLKKEEENKLQKLIENFHYLGLTSVFSIDDLETIKNNQSEIYGILSYFATSLFDKNKVEDVLKDITKNCISKLHLEDCVIYWIDRPNNILKQKAAHGSKSSDKENDSVVNPIDIPLGTGIVGSVAATGVYELISDLSKDKRYIVDDIARLSELAVPIFLNGEVVGVIDSEHSQKNFFTKGHLEIFQLLAILLEKKITQISEKKSLTITNDNIYFKELKQIMQQQKLYRNPTISLVSIAEQLNISPGYLSKLINQITHENFNDFINSFRIEEVKKRLKDPTFQDYSILSIGLESGFNSKSVFYNAFKKLVGASPSEYRKQ